MNEDLQYIAQNNSYQFPVTPRYNQYQAEGRPSVQLETDRSGVEAIMPLVWQHVSFMV